MSDDGSSDSSGGREDAKHGGLNDISDFSSDSGPEEPPQKVRKHDPRLEQIQEALAKADFTKKYGDGNYVVEYTRPGEGSSEEIVTQIVDTVEANMKHYYDLPNINEEYGWVWDKEELRRFTSDPSSRFLLCFPNPENEKVEKERNKTLMGFSVVRFETEDLEEEEDGWCVYIYDIHTTAAGRHKGIGSVLIEALEDLVVSLEGASMLRLTCFLENKNAMSFYRRHGFVSDPDSPSPLVYKDVPHAILRKVVKKEK